LNGEKYPGNPLIREILVQTMGVCRWRGVLVFRVGIHFYDNWQKALETPLRPCRIRFRRENHNTSEYRKIKMRHFSAKTDFKAKTP
jgi:hypothetical protein